MIANAYLDRLIQASQLGLLVRAVKNGLAFGRMTGGSLIATLGGGLEDVPLGRFVLRSNPHGR